MAALIALALDNEMPEDLVKIKAALDNYWHNKIAIVWNVEDVQEYAKQEYNVDIEDEPAREILNDVFDNMDSEYGVTWQSIDCNISDYLKRKDKE